MGIGFDNNMDSFFNPISVAIIGITRKSGPGSYNLMENMLNYGYQHKIFPVNTNAKEILGQKSYSNIKDIKQKVDLAILILPRELVPKSISECAESGVKAAIVVGQGFADVGTKGKELQQEIVKIVKDKGIRILGPNTLGVVNNFNHFTTSFMPLIQEKAPTGLICQSGIFFVGAENFTGHVGKGIDIGNACDIGFSESLKYLGEDPDIKIIAMHMEGLKQGRQFLSLASRIAKEKPIVIFKTGQSEKGARNAASHSGTMAGHYQIYRAALKQSGVHFLDEDGQMRDAVKTLLYLPPMKGNRVAVITPTGAGGIMVSDALERYGLRLASLSETTIKQTAALSPEWMLLGNPLDIWPAAMKNRLGAVYTIALKAVLADHNVDGVLCIGIAPVNSESAYLDVSEVINEAALKESDKPVVAWIYGSNQKEINEKLERKKRVGAYQTIERAVWSLSLLWERRRFLERTKIH